jgi:hypothetical protein
LFFTKSTPPVIFFDRGGFLYLGVHNFDIDGVGARQSGYRSVELFHYLGLISQQNPYSFAVQPPLLISFAPFNQQQATPIRTSQKGLNP